MDNVKEVGAYLYEQLDALAARHTDKIVAHRGIGLMQGLEFKEPVKDVVTLAMKAGLILISAGTNIIRFVPPLVIKKEHVDEMVQILEANL